VLFDRGKAGISRCLWWSINLTRRRGDSGIERGQNRQAHQNKGGKSKLLRIAGLNQRALELTRDMIKTKSEEYFLGESSTETYPLFKYGSIGKSEFFEVIQESPSTPDGQPIVFLTLRDAKGKWLIESLWLNDEIEEVLNKKK